MRDNEGLRRDTDALRNAETDSDKKNVKRLEESERESVFSSGERVPVGCDLVKLGVRVVVGGGVSDQDRLRDCDASGDRVIGVEGVTKW